MKRRRPAPWPESWLPSIPTPPATIAAGDVWGGPSKRDLIAMLEACDLAHARKVWSDSRREPIREILEGDQDRIYNMKKRGERVKHVRDMLHRMKRHDPDMEVPCDVTIRREIKRWLAKINKT